MWHRALPRFAHLSLPQNAHEGLCYRDTALLVIISYIIPLILSREPFSVFSQPAPVVVEKMSGFGRSLLSRDKPGESGINLPE